MNRGVKYRDVAEWLNALFALSVAWLNPSSQLRQSFDRFFSHHTASTVLSRQSLSHAYEALLSSYTGDTGKGVFPVESIYRPWTEDPSCCLPFSSSRGYLNGDAQCIYAPFFPIWASMKNNSMAFNLIISL